MARNRFGGGSADFLYVANGSGTEYRRPNAPVAVTFWSDDATNASRTQYTNLATKDGSTTNLAQIMSLADGSLPSFLGPDDATVVALWASADGGTTGAWIYTSSKDTAGTAGADPAGAAAAAQAAAATDASTKASNAQAAAISAAATDASNKTAALVNGAPSNLDTFGKVAGQMQADEGTLGHKADKWQPNTVYAAGATVQAPGGENVVCTTAHTSGASYSGTPPSPRRAGRAWSR